MKAAETLREEGFRGTRTDTYYKIHEYCSSFLLQHSSTVLPWLEAFWKTCILLEILGRCYTRTWENHSCTPSDGGICFCRGQDSEHVVSSSNADCTSRKLHITCLFCSKVLTMKTRYCPHCRKLPHFKCNRRSTKGKLPSAALPLNVRTYTNYAELKTAAVSISCQINGPFFYSMTVIITLYSTKYTYT